MNTFLGIIPARYASTRFPGKPLANIGGKPMIQRVYERTSRVLENVVVATDDNRILEAVKAFGGEVVMTSESHQSGTDRCFEALNKFSEHTGKSIDVVVNIQGDEPFIRSDQIELLISCFNEDSTDIATLIKLIENKDIIFDDNKPKVIINKKNEAMYFSRSPIPFIRGANEVDWVNMHKFYQHIGMYAYRAKVLAEITKLEQSILEKAESLEQLRWLENGYKIKTAETEFESFGIDTPEDLQKILDIGIV